MVFFKIKVNSFIFVHPISHYKFLVESLRIPYFIYNALFYLYPKQPNFHPPSLTFFLLVHNEPLTPYY